MCPRACGVDRQERRGYCRSYDTMSIGLVSRHMWEEPPISGERGSGTIFFSGCNLGCVYCQNYSLSRGDIGREVTPAGLADIFRMLDDSGVHNINLVTASHYIGGLMRALDIYRPRLPLVFNCGGYESLSQVRALADIVDIWLPDFKYGDAALAERLSNAPDYPLIAREAIKLMRSYRPHDDYDGKIMTSGMIVRHMVLPNHIDNSVAALDMIKDAVGSDTVISLMSQYYPCGDASKYPDISRSLKPLEYKLAVSHASKLGFGDVFVQELSSADGEYTPDFNGYLGERGV